MVNIKEMAGLNAPVFDYDEFLQRIDGDVELLKEVIVIFLEDTPGLLANLYKGIRKGDAKAVMDELDSIMEDAKKKDE